MEAAVSIIEVVRKSVGKSRIRAFTTRNGVKEKATMPKTLPTVGPFASPDTKAQRKILVFSPDPDVAQSLKLLLEDKSEVSCETQLFALRNRLEKESPALLLVDLFPLPTDIIKTITLLKSVERTFPVVFLYVYRSWKPEVEKAIRELSGTILYKPIDAGEVASLITDLLTAEA